MPWNKNHFKKLGKELNFFLANNIPKPDVQSASNTTHSYNVNLFFSSSVPIIDYIKVLPFEDYWQIDFSKNTFIFFWLGVHGN